jgi:integrase
VARRGNGEGMIRLRKDGRWEARIRIAGRPYSAMARTQADARAKLEALRRQFHLGTLVAPQRLTLAEFLDQWLDAGAADWKPKTLHGYRSIIANYWKPELGHVQLQKLTPGMLAACYARWRPGRSGGTLLNAHRCLHRALVVAVRWGLVAKNVADAVEPPKAQRYRPTLWSKEQAAHFLATTRDDRWHVLWAVMLGTGCRLGEAVGLRWRDIDLAAGTVTINGAVGYVGQEAVEGTPKTASGVRVLSLPGFALTALRDWKSKLPTEPGEHERIIILPDGRSPAPWHARNAFRRACKLAGLPMIRRHDLRHFAASLLLAEGLALPAVAARLGHANTAVTATIYSHALKGSDQQAADMLERALAL